MAKLTKSQISAHNEALEILKKEVLNYYDKLFVLENYHEGATHTNGLHGAFFTPLPLALSFSIETQFSGRLVDLCAGIGHLSYYIARNAEMSEKKLNLTCIEFNKEYYEIGKKIIPEATWILGDVTDLKLWQDLDAFNNPFELAYSNPPFGNIKTGINTFPFKTKGDFEFKVVEIACNVANYGVFLLPQGSTPFMYSVPNAPHDGVYPVKGRSSKYDKFSKETGIEFEFNCGIPTYGHKWNDVNPKTEIVTWERNSIFYGEDEAEPTTFSQMSLF